MVQFNNELIITGELVYLSACLPVLSLLKEFLYQTALSSTIK